MTQRNKKMTRHMTWIMVLSVFALMGCEREEPKLPTDQSTTAVEKVVEEAGDTATVGVKAREDEKATTGVADAKVAVNIKAVDKGATKDARIIADATATQGAADAKATAVAAAAQTAADDTTAKATSLPAQLQQYIKDNKVELAETALTQLDGMKGSLPASLQEKIDVARATLTMKKTVTKSFD